MAREFSKAFYNSKEWQTTREAIFKRDNYLCVHCGRPAEEVHHKTRLTPNNIFDTTITLNPSNLVSLCKDCHFEEHTNDKANGHRKGESIDYPYMFDADGNLILKPQE